MAPPRTPLAWCDADGVVSAAAAAAATLEERARARGPVTLPDSRRESEHQLSPEFEEARLNALKDKRKEMVKRAKEATSESAWQWAASRASTTGRPLGPALAACGTRGLAVRCGCGPRTYWRGCRSWWVCKRCRATRLRPLMPRMTESIRARLADAQAGGWRVALRLLTISLRTTGDPVRDRRELGASWRRFYQAMHKWLGAHAYAGVYEVTPGSTGRGHVHMHVAVVWPRFVAYGRVRALWLAASRGDSERISISTRGGDAAAAAGYLAKYLSKGSEELAPALAGKVVAAFYGVRALTASRRFWIPRCGCPRCGERIVRWDAPSSSAAHAAVFDMLRRLVDIAHPSDDRVDPG